MQAKDAGKWPLVVSTYKGDSKDSTKDYGEGTRRQAVSNICFYEKDTYGDRDPFGV